MQRSHRSKRSPKRSAASSESTVQPSLSISTHAHCARVSRCAYCRYHDDHSSGDDGDVSVKSAPNARKELGGHDKADAEIHVVVSRVRRQQIEKARASGALKGVVVERR